MTYEDMVAFACNNGVKVIELPLEHSKGMLCGNVVGIDCSLSEIEKKCVMVEEIAHHALTVGNILDMSVIENRKQEHKARRWAYKTLISQNDIVEAAKHGCRNLYETANFLNVTEEFLEGAIADFRKQYGEATTCGDYLIVYEPGLYVYDLRDSEA